MVSSDVAVIITLFCISVAAFAGLLSAVILMYRSFYARDGKWRIWLLENSDTPPKNKVQFIPLMSRQEILDQGELLDTIN